MKQLFFAGSFAIAAFLAFAGNGNTTNIQNSRDGITFQSGYDTLPKSKKDSLNKKKHYGKDSTMKKDSLHPLKDTVNQ